jgi:hypothetical protein
MDTINILSSILKFFGWLSILIGLLLSLQLLGNATEPLLLILSNFQMIVGGIVFLSLSRGLSKREKWSFYISFIIFSIYLLQSIIKFFYIESSFSLIVGIIELASLFLLIIGREQFIKQPKEQISQWFRRKYFIIAVTGIIISYIISGIAFGLLKETGITIFQLL